MSLLPITSKIFEKAIYHNLLNYYERENLLNINQSGFRSNHSCITQLIPITHEIYRSVVTHRSKLEVYSWIYPKPLMRFAPGTFIQT